MTTVTNDQPTSTSDNMDTTEPCQDQVYVTLDFEGGGVTVPISVGVVAFKVHDTECSKPLFILNHEFPFSADECESRCVREFWRDPKCPEREELYNQYIARYAHLDAPSLDKEKIRAYREFSDALDAKLVQYPNYMLVSNNPEYDIGMMLTGIYNKIGRPDSQYAPTGNSEKPWSYHGTAINTGSLYAGLLLSTNSEMPIDDTRWGRYNRLLETYSLSKEEFERGIPVADHNPVNDAWNILGTFIRMVNFVNKARS